MYHESMLSISEHTNKFQAHKIGLDAMDAKLRLESKLEYRCNKLMLKSIV